MKKKGTQTVENTTEDELKTTEDELKATEDELITALITEAAGGSKKGQKVDKEGSGWTSGGIEHQDGAGRPCVWSPVTGEEGTRPHAHSCAGAWTASCRRNSARDGA